MAVGRFGISGPINFRVALVFVVNSGLKKKDGAMDAQNNRRKCERQALDPPGLGYLLTEDSGYKSGTAIIDPPLNLYVDVLNTCRGGAAVKTPRPIEPDTAVSLLTYNDGEKLWYVSQGEVKWTIRVSGPFNNFLVGLEIKTHAEAGEKLSLAAECTEILNPSDLDSSIEPSCWPPFRAKPCVQF